MNRKKFLKLGVLAAILAPITKAFSNPIPEPKQNSEKIYICVNGEPVLVEGFWVCGPNGQNIPLSTYFEHCRA